MINIKQHWPDFNKWQEDLQAIKTKLKNPDEEHSLVIYTDGGCRPTSRGHGGWGIHGYVYIDPKPKQGHGCKGFINTKDGYTNLTGDSDGDVIADSIKDKTVSVLTYFDGLGAIEGESTNNSAELYALIAALELILELKPKRAIIKPDSEYVLRGCTVHLPKWEAKKFINNDGNKRPNIELWLQIKELLDKVVHSTELKWMWVKGHKDSIGNNIADRTATEAVFLAMNGKHFSALSYSVTKDYWSPVANNNKMFGESFWVFTTNTSGHILDDGYRLYHGVTIGDGNIQSFGRPNANTVYNVLLTKRADVALENVREAHNGFKRAVEGVIVLADLNVLLKPKIYNKLEQTTNHLFRAPYKLVTVDPQGLELTHELEEPRLGLNGLNALESLTAFLLAHTKGTTNGIAYTDITDDIYETTVNKKGEKEMKVKLVPGDTENILRLDINYPKADGTISKRNIPLTIGLELPRRTILTGNASRLPSVKIIAWSQESECDAFRYACIIETEDSDVGIWAAYYTNLSIDPNIKSKT